MSRPPAHARYPLSAKPPTPTHAAHASARRRGLRGLLCVHNLRASLALKAALCIVVAGVVVLVVLAVGAANAPPLLGSAALDDIGAAVAARKDNATVPEPVPEIHRSFEEPDYALLANPQPHEIGCDVPLEGPDAGALAFIGIFSTAQARGRRDLYRELIVPDFPPELFTIKFILGQPKADKTGKKGLKETWRRLNDEMAEHDDIVLLDIEDNIDFGKTHEYFKWVERTYGGPGVVKGRPRFVMKCDDDTVLVMPNVVSSFSELDCSENIYWGTSAGRSGHFQDYFRGLAYAVSWPLAAWIGGADMPYEHTVKIEDARTGQWLRLLQPITDVVRRVDMGWNMGDWNQLNVSVFTVALHWLKMDDWVREQHARVHEVWKQSGMPFEGKHGRSNRRLIQTGIEKPEEAKKERERQKSMGWDTT